MRIGFYQFAPTFHNRDTSLARIEQALSRAEADLVVLPEMCTTGYLFESRGELACAAEPVPGGPTCRFMTRLARDRGLAIVWGMPEADGARIFNDAVMALPDGGVHKFRKAHLFVDEKDIFTPGDMPFPVFDMRPSVKVGMLVCFDHYFPEAARSLALAGAQVICHPANLVLDVAQRTTVVRALENRVFWILANRTGVEELGRKHLSFTGRSQIVAPGGTVLVHAGPDSEQLCIVDVDPALALDKKATPRNDLFADRRTDLYRLRAPGPGETS
jgi:predicted amidohydrolase